MNSAGDLLVGRDHVLAGFADALSAIRRTSRALSVAGSRGLGRSVVLSSLANLGRRNGAHVLTATGEPTRLSAIHSLFGRYAGLADELQAPHRTTLTQLFRGEPVDGTEAAAALIARLAVDRPLVICVDDIDLSDPLSQATIAALAERLPDRNVLLVHTSVASSTASFTLTPLADSDAEHLLARQPSAPTGSVARTIIEQAAGNPLALVELAALAARRPELVRTTVAALPPTPCLSEAFGGYRELPRACRHALSLVAAGLHNLAVLSPLVEADVWRPAIDCGVIRVDATEVHFTHPMTAAVVYYGQEPGHRRRTHRQLAQILAGTDPVTAAWQLALAGDTVDEDAADLLERQGEHLIRRADYSLAGRLLTAASQLSTSPEDAERRRRLADRTTIEAGWNGDLEPGVRATGALAGDELVRTAEDAYIRGTVTATPHPQDADGDMAFWAAVVADPSRARGEALDALRRHRLRSTTAGHDRLDGRQAGMIGLAASALDATEDAIYWFEQAGARGSRFDATCNGLLRWAYYDAGRYEDAAREPDTARGFAGQSTDLIHVTLAGLRSTRDIPRQPDSAIDPRDQPYLAARALQSRALVAAGAGDHATAWWQLASLFSPDGAPIHYLLSDLALGDLAAAARRTDHVEIAAKIVAEALARHASGISLRLRLVLHRAQALLAGLDRAEHHFRLALVHPGGGHWPVERALARLEYAEWLRRRQRPTEARDLLIAARETFAARGMCSWVSRANSELRAADGRPSGSHALTAQQRQVALLAADGLSNQQIADRLALSSRTVGSHLSRAFTTLGIHRRTQLKSALAQAPATPASEHISDGAPKI